MGKDGKTAAERCKGKRATVVGLEFGEKVLWKKVGGSRAEKFRGRWEYGIFIGVRRRSGEFWVADKDGKVQAIRSVRRLAVEERWGKDNRRWVKGVPWNRYKGDEYQDGEIPKGVEVEEKVDENCALGGVRKERSRAG